MNSATKLNDNSHMVLESKQDILFDFFETSM